MLQLFFIVSLIQVMDLGNCCGCISLKTRVISIVTFWFITNFLYLGYLSFGYFQSFTDNDPKLQQEVGILITLLIANSAFLIILFIGVSIKKSQLFIPWLLTELPICSINLFYFSIETDEVLLVLLLIIAGENL